MINYPVQVVIKTLDRATGPIRQVATALGGLRGPLAGIRGGFAAAGIGDLVRRNGTAFSELGTAATRAGDRVRNLLGPIAAIGGVAAVAGVVRLGTGFAAAGSEIAAAAARIGIGAESLQELRFAAKLNRVEQGQLDQSLAGLNRAITDAARGKSDDLVALFQKLHIATRGATGEIRSAVDVLPELSEALRANANPNLRNAIARALQIDPALVPLLAQGKEALAGYASEARRLGVVLGERALRAAVEYEEAQTRLGFSLVGLRNAIGAQLLPSLRPLIEKMTEWIAVNREIIAQRFEQIVGAVADALARVDFDKALDGLTRFLGGVVRAVEFVGGWQNAIVGVAIAMNAGLILSILQLGKALSVVGLAAGRVAASLGALAFTQVAAAIGNFIVALRAGYSAMAALNLVMAVNPIGAVIVAVAALAAAVYLIYQNWDGIAAWFENKWTAVREAFSAGLVAGIMTLLAEFNPVVLLAEAINSIVAYLTGVDLFDAGRQLIGRLIDGFRSLLPDFEGIWNLITGAIDRVGSFFGLGGRAAEQPRLPVAGPGLIGRATAVGAGGQNGAVDVNVRFENAPRGTRVAADATGAAEAAVNVGYSLGDMGTY
ncbi:MAG: hypothetical protein HY057_08960 [Rhodospirillales bacterium]|nr:hypothetical protein [Rhodospirillales bacterium]